MSGTTKTGQAEAGRTVVPDLEELAGMDPGPEYVRVYIPPRAWPNLVHRLFILGLWALLTTGEWEAERSPPEDRVMVGLRDAPEPFLAMWKQQKLGYPVTLERDHVALRATRRFARWHEEPIYWVRRDT